MVDKRTVTCAKCGITSKEDTSLTFHRFPAPSTPQRSLKAKVWAKFCYPENDWNDRSLHKLYSQYEMLCGRHFDESSYLNSDRIKLNKFAIPYDAKHILAQLRDQLQNPEGTQQETRMELQNIVSTSSNSVEFLTEYNLVSPNPCIQNDLLNSDGDTLMTIRKKKERNREYQRAFRQRKKNLEQKDSKEIKDAGKRKRHRENQRAYYQRKKVLKKNVEELFQKKLDDLQIKQEKLDSNQDQENVVQCRASQNLENEQLEQNHFLTQQLRIYEESHECITPEVIIHRITDIPGDVTMKAKVFDFYEISSDEDEPLMSIVNKKWENKIENKEKLTKYSIEKCEFCDEQFNNKYKSFIHNASHIIIPLIKEKYYQCPECLFQYKSLQELNSHISNTHLKTKVEVVLVPVKEEVLNIDKVESLNLDELIEVDKKENKSNVDFKEDISYDGFEIKKEEKVKNRLVFEDELENDILSWAQNNLFQDLTTDCQVNLEMFDLPMPSANDELPQHESTVVPYSELILPNLYICQWCEHISLNRFESIQHETYHMTMKTDRYYLCFICERFIAGDHNDFKRHEQEKHQLTNIHNNAKSKFCNVCGLIYFNYTKHEKYYHFIYKCNQCTERFASDEERIQHSKIHIYYIKCNKCNIYIKNVNFGVHKCKKDVIVLKVCDVCSMFYKYRFGQLYKVLGHYSEEGVRLPCDSCGKMYLELIRMKRELTVTTEPSQKLKPKRPSRPSKKRSLTKIERLINIKKRLIQMNKS